MNLGSQKVLQHDIRFHTRFCWPVYCVVIARLLFPFSHCPDNFLGASLKLQVEIHAYPPLFFFFYKSPLYVQNSHSPRPKLKHNRKAQIKKNAIITAQLLDKITTNRRLQNNR
jgi:hypothetical protein